MTLTICIDKISTGVRPRLWTSRQSGKLWSWRITWLWVAVAWYSFDDYELATSYLGWSED